MDAQPSDAADIPTDESGGFTPQFGETLAVAAIVVDAKSQKAAAFYQHFGFIELPGQPGRWMLSRSHFSGLA
ncbi:hypothetical protein [Ectothiorhodospira shaposhnikovii]|uniref:hypothetical protein n=1 Tax=Ectothiorhodospira shaposhnikovii TaxID=1054 RepID=UPI001EE83E40|nr:hypothetical protein [Ectothiorhodospira shaposhnikovii]MCG5514472.1 hypothetical protein [Ectothiorhodospira shaposhnikovii]